MTISEAVREVRKIYGGLGWPSLFARLKFSAAPFTQIIPLVPDEGVIIDLGCGYGILSNMLGILSKNRHIIGIDLDERKISTAHRGVSNVSFHRANIITSDIPHADCIVIVHVLHHLPNNDAQEKVLRACIERLKPGGKLIVTEVDRDPRWKYILSWTADHVLYPRDTITFRPQSEWLSLFSQLFLNVHVVSMHKRSLFPHITFVATKSM